MPVSRAFRPVPYIAAGDAFISKARDISIQDTRNMYVLATPNAKTQAALISYPGLKPWSTGGAVGVDRGIYRREFKGKGYHVAGTQLYSIAGGGQRVAIGTIAGSDRVSMIDNGNVLLIVGGGKMYQYDGSELLTLNTVSQSGNTFVPVDVDYLNDKFIALADNGLIYVANVGETNFVNGFYDAESSPDSTIALKVFDQTVLNMGTDSIEPWQDVGTGSPPLARVSGGIIENTGIANKNALDITSDAVYFLGRDMIPYALINFLVNKLTDQNPGIAELFREYDRDSATVHSLKWKGQEFIQFRFPVDKKVWVFSPNTGLWFQLDHGVNKDLYLGGSTAFIFNKQIVADYASGTLYELDDDTYTNNGTAIVRERTFRVIDGATLGVGRTALQMRSIQYLVETGVGINDSNPQMIVQYSIDGGRSFTNEKWLRLGKTGDYVTVEDNSNRKFNDLIVKIKYTEPTAFTIYNANIHVREAGRLISRVVGSQVGDFPYVPPPKPFIWDDNKKADDAFIEKIDEGTLRIKQYNTTQPTPFKSALTETFDFIREYDGLVYLEMEVLNLSGGYRDGLRFFLQPNTELEQYESLTSDFGFPHLDNEDRKFVTNELLSELFSEEGIELLPDDRRNFSVFDINSIAIDFTRTADKVRVWARVDGGAWIGGGDPALNTTPTHEYNSLGVDWTNYKMYFALGTGWSFDTVGEGQFDFRIYGNETHPFNYTVPTGFNGT